jgi:nitrite reductase/ring-hydroxylating ferredoxin subunit
MTEPTKPDTDCAADCVLARRIFLRDMAFMAAGLVAAGLAPRGAGAMPTPVLALLRTKNEVRYPIPAKDGVQFDKANEVILVRYVGKVYAFALSCPHQNTALGLDPSGVGFQCSKHHSKYKPDGTFIEGRATRNMDRLVIRKDGNAVVVDVAKWFESDSEPTQWAGAVVTL